jgi:hypothetical protein
MECLESKILKTKMFEFLCMNTESWKLKFVCEMLEFENLKTKMFKFGCVNIESWKLKTKMFEY